MATKFLTNNYKLHIARQFQESVTEVSNTSYYFFLGEHLPRNIENVPDLNTSNRNISVDPYRNMIMGKRISSQDISLVIRNIPYVANTVYEMYDDITNDLLNKNFYVVVDEGSFKHVYKCLDNNNRAKSTFEPNFSHITGSNTIVYQTADGYRWKYMYSVSSTIVNKFGTFDFIPVVANTVVQSQAVDGAIDIIKVESPGRGYHNYVIGTFSPQDLRINGDPTLYNISNTVAPAVNGFFTGCILYLSSGIGAGAYKRIIDYYVSSNTGQRIVKLESEFIGSDNPGGDTEYQIFPEVKIIGDGKQQINAVARALVNSAASNSIYRIEVLQRGKNYSFIEAEVIANSVVQVSRQARVRPIYSPPGGHGFDVASELGSSRISLSITFANNESNTILTDNQVQQIGFLKDPKFNNVKYNFTNPDGSFEINEKVYKISPIRINTNASLSITNNILTCNSAEFTEQVKTNDFLYLKSSNGTSHQIVTVTAVSNDTQIIISSNGLFSCNETKVYLANVTSFGYVNEITPTFIKCSNVFGVFQANDKIIGETSGAYAVIDSISRSGINKDFNTFIQLFKYVVTVTSGVFIENERVFIGIDSNNQTANASIHSIINIGGNDRIIYTSNQIGTFAVSSQITGLMSGATAVVNEIYDPELVFGSGDILYLENVEAFERDPSRSETFKLILSF